MITMIAKCTVLVLAALTLANCCALGNGCAPVSSAAPTAWDGLGSAPTDDMQPVDPPPGKHARAKKEIILGPLGAAAAERTNKVQPKDQWEKDQAADQDDESKLKRKLIICSTC
ncbi:hypothetical protein [Bradyrhizobium sp.]|uniref:hypothetical protein n=1 Tax=Bradyrhizobium sp. TaxID=376 RepID=UPI0025BC13EB|nr:hypothetical protein [Bradyrhizobium sp.]